MTESTSRAHLLMRLAVLHDRLAEVVAHRRPNAFNVDDPLRGMTISARDAEALLAEDADHRWLPIGRSDVDAVADAEAVVDELEVAGEPTRLRLIQRRFGLDALDTELLLIAALADLDHRAGPVLGFLNDDVTNKRPTVATALLVAGCHPLDGAARCRLSRGSPLVSSGLVSIDETRSFLGRIITVAEPVVAFLTGDDRDLADRWSVTPDFAGVRSDALARLLTAGVARIYVAESSRGSAWSIVLGSVAAPSDVSIVDLDRLSGAEMTSLLPAMALRSRLRGQVLVAGPIDRWRTDRSLPRLDAVLDRADRLVLHGRGRWDPHSAGWDVVEIAAPKPSGEVWATVVGPDDDVDLEALRPFAVAAHEATRAATIARSLAAADSTAMTTDHLLAGARARNSAGLEQRARRVSPAVRLTDMVVPGHVAAALNGLVGRVRHRDEVLGEWAMRPGGGRGRGVTALFAGDPGTGKTMAAEAVAAELGFELYVVDLSAVVDKYIGETEKHLDRIFEEAAGVCGVLLFDEADALFGKRSEVSDAKDRNANIEVAYLLQRMERFDGVAVLTTNLRANLDEAFTRRLDVIVDFPAPDEQQRLLLWEAAFGRRVPRDPDLDLRECARAFDLSGGAIRAAAVGAAYLAAARAEVVTMLDVVNAVAAEYRKLGRLIRPEEFGAWHASIVSGDG